MSGGVGALVAGGTLFACVDAGSPAACGGAVAGEDACVAVAEAAGLSEPAFDAGAVCARRRGTAKHATVAATGSNIAQRRESAGINGLDERRN
jgi:hypothetical protein